MEGTNQPKFEVGAAVHTFAKNLYIIKNELGAGSQGVTYSAVHKTSSVEKVVKVLFSIDAYRRIGVLHNDPNCKKLIDKQFEFVISEELFSATSAQGERGYVMKYVGETCLDKMLKDGSLSALNREMKFTLARNICLAFERLHNIGYCYQDISLNNIRVDLKTLKVYVIDCDNIAAERDILNNPNAMVMGTGWFIAPEVAFRKRKAVKAADRYALAVLMLYLLTGICHSPYLGKIFYEEFKFSPSDLDDFYGVTIDNSMLTEEKAISSLIFIFDENDRRNSLDVKFQKMTPARERTLQSFEQLKKAWANIPKPLQELFMKAFRNPVPKDLNELNHRPSPYEWSRAFANLLSPPVAKTPPVVKAKPVAKAKAAAPKAAAEPYLMVNGQRMSGDLQKGITVKGSDCGSPFIADVFEVKRSGAEYVLTNRCVFRLTVDDASVGDGKTATLKDGSKIFYVHSSVLKAEFHLS